ncbi:hypothetical protein P2318_01660 [Myxococcaceae bacterium GXIMD 01537]
MRMKHFSTTIFLPPGVPAGDRVRELFRLAFAKYRWFKPATADAATNHEVLDPNHVDIDKLVSLYKEFPSITVMARTERDYVMVFPARADEPPYIGQLIWDTSLVEAKKPSWRDAHLRQVTELMRLFDSPLALAGPAEDYFGKTNRLVPNPDGFGQKCIATVTGYGEGLPGMLWRNFYGPPFTQLFSERLDTLPADTRQDLGGGITLVQPYALPTEAGTPEATAREQQLISLLGPDCFYDFERHLKPTRLPHLPLHG